MLPLAEFAVVRSRQGRRRYGLVGLLGRPALSFGFCGICSRKEPAETPFDDSQGEPAVRRET